MILGILLLIFGYILFKGLKRFLKKRKISTSGRKDCQIVGQSVFTDNPFPMTQQDQRHMKMIKRIDQAFKEQKKDIQTRSTKAHGVDCAGILNCNKAVCFVLEPDKIVAKGIVKIKSKTQRLNERKKELDECL